MKERLDVLLVDKGFFESREKAKRAIMAGVVLVNDQKIDKAGTKVDYDSELRIKGEVLKYVSRGGLKLEKAIDVFGLDFSGKKILDVGASTGGFTDCSLQNGAEYVYSVDVGTNQLAWSLRNNEKVKSLENTHIKDLKIEDLDSSRIDFIVIDVSFISLTKVFEHLVKFMGENTGIVALIKPQFEVGRERIGKGGIVREPENHKFAVDVVVEKAEELGLYLKKIDISPIKGGKGNIEYISYFDKDIENKENHLAIDEVTKIMY